MYRAQRIVAIGVLLLSGIVAAFSVSVAHAAPNSTFNQTINAGTLATDILDASRVPVASPSVTMTPATFSFTCQTTTGTFGTNTERIYVTNPDAADNGWTLTLAATAGTTALWSTGIDFNDTTGVGCTDGVDTDTKAGRLTVDPSVATITTDCASCVVTNVAKGSSTAFAEGTTNSVTLLTAAAASDDIWRGYLTGVGLSQTIPAETAAGSYSINMTLTTTAQ